MEVSVFGFFFERLVTKISQKFNAIFLEMIKTRRNSKYIIEPSYGFGEKAFELCVLGFWKRIAITKKIKAIFFGSERNKKLTGARILQSFLNYAVPLVKAAFSISVA